jgi:cell wall-associated NlpC family hydrolase
VAKAAQLEAQIVAQSDTLDVLAENYDRAEQVLQAATAEVDRLQAEVDAASASQTAIAAGIARATQSLREVAIDAYINNGATSAAAMASSLIDTYERHRTIVETALARAAARVKQLRGVERRQQEAQSSAGRAQQQASGARAAAQSAAAQAQSAAQAAAYQQATLMATLSQAGGNLAQLVAVADAAQVQAAFDKFSTNSSLDFPLLTPLAPPLAQTATALQSVLTRLGTPYVWGATGPDSFDCSGLVQWAWSQAGIHVPRVASDQQVWATPVPISQLMPGDLVFFGSPAHHVGMYVGNGKMINAPKAGSSVSVVPLWWHDLTGFGRVHQP